MKILYLSADLGIPVFGGKGAAVHVRAMVDALSHAGHEVVLAAPMLTKSPWEKPAQVDGLVCHLPPSDEIKDTAMNLKAYHAKFPEVATAFPGEIRRMLYNQQLENQLVRRFDSFPPDFIYERVSLYSTAGATLAREIDRPLLVELNAPLAEEQSRYRGTGLGLLAAEAERWTLTRADVVFTVSDQLSDYAISLGVSPTKVQSLPNGVNPRQFSPERSEAEITKIRRRYGLEAGPVLGFVGGLRPWHGVGAFPELLTRLIPEFPNVRLVVVGDGPMRHELQRQLTEAGVDQHVHLLGAVPHQDIPGLIRTFDVALAPYPQLEHTFYFSPLKLFEYMACGVPVVVPSIGQMEKLITHEKTGILYPAGDTKALATACSQLLRDPLRQKSVGQQGAELVLSRFTWDHNARVVTRLAEQWTRVPTNGVHKGEG